MWGLMEGCSARRRLRRRSRYIRERPTIREVILTGGDPLMLSPRRLGAILAALDAIPHVELLRVHTRVPVADPSRVTGELAAVLATEKPLWVVLHANHAREFSAEARAAVRCIQRQGVPVPWAIRAVARGE